MNYFSDVGGVFLFVLVIIYILLPIYAINCLGGNLYGPRDEQQATGEIAILVWALISLIISFFLLVWWSSDNDEKKKELKALKEKLDNAMRERESLNSSNSNSFKELKKSPES